MIQMPDGNYLGKGRNNVILVYTSGKFPFGSIAVSDEEYKGPIKKIAENNDFAKRYQSLVNLSQEIKESFATVNASIRF